MIWTLFGTVAVAMVISLATYVSAFEANTINITSFVQQAIVTGKTFVVATTHLKDEFGFFVDLDGNLIPENGKPVRGNEFGHVDQNIPEVVPLQTESCWDVTLSVENNTAEEMWWQVVVRDKFSAEMTDPQAELSTVPVVVHEMNQTKGKGKGKRSSGAINIIWWVDYDPDPQFDNFNPDYDPEHPDPSPHAFTPEGEIEDDDDNFKTPAPGSSGLGPGMSESLTMYVCTGRNPADKWEYTSENCYNFNSGLNVRYLRGVWVPGGEPPYAKELELHQMSLDGNVLGVIAIDGGEVPSPPTGEKKTDIKACTTSVQNSSE